MADDATLISTAAAIMQPSRDVHFAPIRHHSPACAWAVRALIQDVRPTQILIEAPRDFEPMIDLLLHAETRPPVALTAICDADADGEARRRVVSYYPFCDHSPEYVALAEGRKAGAQLKFIDLPSGDKSTLGAHDDDPRSGPEDESYFDSGDVVRGLCRKTGCRDGYELWDHLFESRLGDADWRAFLADVGTYCAGLRAATTRDDIERRGDATREAHMASVLHAALASDGPIVVVAGGFHVPALLASLDEPAPADAMKKATPADAYLIRYSYAALDALNGYAAGLPQPAYYSDLWQRANEANGTPPWQEAALDLLSRFALQSREAGFPMTVPAQVEALRAAESLARLRGRRGPGRHDLIDAVRTAFVKGEVSGREAWTERLLAFLRGDAIGDVPASAGSPPLVEDARRRARAVRIDVSDGARRRRSLDIRRKPAHLKASRYFHAMTLLESGFAERQAGPDFVHGVNLQRLFEDWSYAWSPGVEGRLIELSILGDDLESACVGVLARKQRELAASGEARDIGQLAGWFVAGVIAGLGEHLTSFLQHLAESIQAHGEFESVTQTMMRLRHIAHASGPLAAPAGLDLNGVLETAYARLVYLCEDLAQTPEERVMPVTKALRSVVDMLREPPAAGIDAALFDEAIDRVADSQPPPMILGAVLSLCVQSGRRDADELCRAMRSTIEGTTERDEDRVGVLQGVLATAPELLWQIPAVLHAIDHLLNDLSEAQFLDLLPHIRLAFTALNPRDADRLAALLADLHGGRATDFAARIHTVTEQELARGMRTEAQINAALEADGLTGWFEAQT
ncbi:MAG: DUF5682 family protein [Gammaproteobacteria bacterium]